MGDPFVCPGLSYAPEIESVLLKHEGTIGLLSTKEDWIAAQHRDTLGSFLMHDDEMSLLCIAENVCPQRMRRSLLERLADPLQHRKTTETHPVPTTGASLLPTTGRDEGSMPMPTMRPRLPE